MLKRLLVVIVCLGAVFGGIAYLKYKQFRQFQAQMSQPRAPATVASAQVRTETWQSSLRAVGSLVAVNGTEVTTEVAGIVDNIRFKSGQVVGKGAVLVNLDDTVDRATLLGLQADQRLAEVQFRRAADLLPRRAVSQSDFDAAKATYDSARAKVKEQRAKVDKKSIRAPFSGLLGIRRVNLGEFLSPGTAVVELNALDPIYVDYSLPERYFRQLTPGQRVEVRLDAYPGETFRGKVTAIDSGVAKGTRTINVRAMLPNIEQRLRPGMFAEVQTLEGRTRDVQTVPRTAVSFNTYGDFVYVIESGKDGHLTARRRQVQTGEVRQGRVVITKGLQAEERVVRSGLVKLRDGQAVQIDNSVKLDDAEITHE